MLLSVEAFWGLDEADGFEFPPHPVRSPVAKIAAPIIHITFFIIVSPSYYIISQLSHIFPLANLLVNPSNPRTYTIPSGNMIVLLC